MRRNSSNQAKRAGSAKSVFHFDEQGSVAKSTPEFHGCGSSGSGSGRVHFWPFEGWDVPACRSAFAEVYPRMWSGIAREDRTVDQHDAFSVCRPCRRSVWVPEARPDPV